MYIYTNIFGKYHAYAKWAACSLLAIFSRIITVLYMLITAHFTWPIADWILGREGGTRVPRILPLCKYFERKLRYSIAKCCWSTKIIVAAAAPNNSRIVNQKKKNKKNCFVWSFIFAIFAFIYAITWHLSTGIIMYFWFDLLTFL